MAEPRHESGAPRTAAAAVRQALSRARCCDACRAGRSGRDRGDVQPGRSALVESHAKGMRDLGDRLTESQVESLIGTVAALLGSVVHGRAPIVEGELPINGYRFEGILPPVSTAPTFVIRKRASQVYGLDDYVKAGILTPAQQRVLVDAVRDRRNILIAGGTAFGKTTLANALMREIVAPGDPTERIVILEDTRELQCEGNAVQLHTGDVADLTRLVRVT